MAIVDDVLASLEELRREQGRLAESIATAKAELQALEGNIATAKSELERARGDARDQRSVADAQSARAEAARQEEARAVSEANRIREGLAVVVTQFQHGIADVLRG